MTLSSVSGAGVTDALRQLVAVIDESRDKEILPEEAAHATNQRQP